MATEDVSSLQIRIESDGVNGATGSLKIFIQTSERAERATRELKKESSSLDGILGGLKAKTAALGLSTAALGAAAIKTTKDWLAYDKAMKEVASITAGTRQEMVQLRSDVLKLSTAIGVDATVAAKGLYQAMSAGVPKENAFKFLETASKTAIAGVTSVDVAVDGLTNVINAWKMEVGDAEAISDRLFMAVVDGKVTFEELARNMSKASVPAAALGVSLEEVLSWLVATTSQGTPASEAFTQLKATITALQDPSDELLVVYKQLGVESGRQAIAQFGLQETLNKVTDAYRGNDAQLVKALRSSEAFNGVLSVTGDNADKSADSLDRLKSASGNMASAYATNSATLETSLNSLKSSAIGLVETMENSLGMIAAFTEALQGAAQIIQTLSGMDLTASTQSALSQGGIAGAGAIQARIGELKYLQSQLQDAYNNGDLLTGIGERNGGFGEEGLLGGRKTITGSLEDLTKELGTLEQAYARVTPEAKALGEEMNRMNAIREGVKVGAISEADYAKSVEESKKIVEKITNATKAREQAETAAADAKLAKDKEKEERAKNALKLAQENEASAKAEADQLEKTLDLARDLSTTEHEKLRAKQDSIQAAIDGGKLDAETGAKAIEALNKEIALLDERNAKKGGKGGGSGGEAPKGFGSLAAEYALPDLHSSSLVEDDNLLDRLADEEQKLHESYEKRRQAIVDSEKLTGEQKIAAMKETEEAYFAELQKYQAAQNKAYLGYAADFFGDLASIAGSFGKKGQKVAKGFAIAQATIKTYESATAAYSSLAGIPYVGPALGIAAAGAAVAAGLANVNKIRSTDYAGEYALGGNIPAGKYGLVGEAGPELVHGPAMVTSAHATRERAGGAAGGAPSSFVVHNYAGPLDMTGEVRQNADGGQEMVLLVRHVEKELSKKVRTGGSDFSRSLEETFQLPRGKR